jgi:hypothetical protein
MDININDWYYDISSNDEIHSLTPFNKVYYPDNNQLHLEINNENVEWFLNELAAIDLEICDEVVEEGQVDIQVADNSIEIAGGECTYIVESGGTSKIRAKNQIYLKPGFEARMGSKFSAGVHEM